MVDVASVPLMDDVQGEEEGMGRKDMEGGGIDSDFSYNNNVAGASKHVRLGERKIYNVLIQLLCRVYEEGVWATCSSADHHNHNRYSLDCRTDEP